MIDGTSPVIDAAASKTALDIHEILKILPHRYPFLLIDRVLELKRKESIVAIKNVTIKAGFSNSNIAASHVNKVSIKGLNTSNGGTPFGVAAQALGSINAPPLKWNAHLSPSLLTPIGDFEVNLI